MLATISVSRHARRPQLNFKRSRLQAHGVVHSQSWRLCHLLNQAASKGQRFQKQTFAQAHDKLQHKKDLQTKAYKRLTPTQFYSYRLMVHHKNQCLLDVLLENALGT